MMRTPQMSPRPDPRRGRLELLVYLSFRWFNHSSETAVAIVAHLASSLIDGISYKDLCQGKYISGAAVTSLSQLSILDRLLQHTMYVYVHMYVLYVCTFGCISHLKLHSLFHSFQNRSMRKQPKQKYARKNGEWPNIVYPYATNGISQRSYINIV